MRKKKTAAKAAPKTASTSKKKAKAPKATVSKATKLDKVTAGIPAPLEEDGEREDDAARGPFGNDPEDSDDTDPREGIIDAAVLVALKDGELTWEKLHDAVDGDLAANETSTEPLDGEELADACERLKITYKITQREDGDTDFYKLASDEDEAVEPLRTRYLEHVLTPEELEELTDERDRNDERIDQLDVEVSAKKEELKDLDAELKGLVSKNKKLSRTRRKGSEWRNVECREERIDRLLEWHVIRCDTDEVIDKRPFTKEERQGNLFEPHELKKSA